MPFPTWLFGLRRLLIIHPQADMDEGGWSDDNLRRYHEEEFSPAAATMEVQFRALARS